MAITFNTNVSSLHAQHQLTLNTQQVGQSIERLASGYRINTSDEDAAGLQISENLRTQVRGSRRATDNIQDGMGVLNITDGALGTITEHLQRMRELVVQAASDINDPVQRAALKQEIDARAAEIDRIGQATEFNGIFLLNGSVDGAGNFTLQVGQNDTSGLDTLDLGAFGAFAQIDATTLGVDAASTNVTDNANALTTLTAIDSALDQVNNQRTSVGTAFSQLESALQYQSIGQENVASAESRIRNVDVANETAMLTRNQILQTASLSVLAQANQSPSLALRLVNQ